MAEGTIVECRLCPSWAIWSTELSAKCAATWHVYEQHYDVWLKVIGDRGPEDPRPGSIGTLLATST